MGCKWVGSVFHCVFTLLQSFLHRWLKGTFSNANQMMLTSLLKTLCWHLLYSEYKSKVLIIAYMVWLPANSQIYILPLISTPARTGPFSSRGLCIASSLCLCCSSPRNRNHRLAYFIP